MPIFTQGEAMPFLEKVWKYKVPISLNLVASGIAQLVPLYYKLPDFQAEVKSCYPAVDRFLTNNPVHVFLINWFALFLLPMISILMVKKVISKTIPMDEEKLSIFFAALEQPVQVKLNRFARKAVQILSAHDKPSGKKIFDEITQPRKQCKRIIEALYSFYMNVDNRGADFKVVLYFIEDGAVQKDVIYAPPNLPPATSIATLSAPDAPIMTAVRTREPVILEDIQDRSGPVKFVFRDKEDHRTGSLLCYPIVINHMGVAPMVLSVFSNVPNYFNKTNKPVYDYVFRKFQSRLAIEYCLMIIKHSVNGTGGKI